MFKEFTFELSLKKFLGKEILTVNQIFKAVWNASRVTHQTENLLQLGNIMKQKSNGLKWRYLGSFPDDRRLHFNILHNNILSASI